MNIIELFYGLNELRCLKQLEFLAHWNASKYWLVILFPKTPSLSVQGMLYLHLFAESRICGPSLQYLGTRFLGSWIPLGDPRALAPCSLLPTLPWSFSTWILAMQKSQQWQSFLWPVCYLMCHISHYKCEDPKGEETNWPSPITSLVTKVSEFQCPVPFNATLRCTQGLLILCCSHGHVTHLQLWNITLWALVPLGLWCVVALA
jgi:hypothetical protein